MPKVDLKAVSSQLGEHGECFQLIKRARPELIFCKPLGLAIRCVNGEYTVVEHSNGFIGLPRKLRAVQVFVGIRPEKRTPGRGKAVGYNLQARLQMSTSDYRLVYVSSSSLIMCVKVAYALNRATPKLFLNVLMALTRV